MKRTAVADLQRWSEEVARDPASLAFLPLARAYRRQDRSEAALRLCLRGLERHPDNLEAHALLALLYLEKGDRARAADEWSMILRLDAANFDALRGLGFCFLEEGDVVRAREHLQRAAVMRPDDGAVRGALRMAVERAGGAGAAPAAAEPAAVMEDEPWMLTPSVEQTEGEGEGVRKREGEAVRKREAEAGGTGTGTGTGMGMGAIAVAHDPVQLFAPLIGGPIEGVLLLDARGMVLAGGLGERGGNAEALAATLDGAIDEAARTASLLGLGAWRGLLLETPVALLHISRAGPDSLVLIVARPDAPAGWILRSATQAAGIARRFLEAYA
jgi:tetratricopeptide (TPR) repeat protein